MSVNDVCKLSLRVLSFVDHFKCAPGLGLGFPIIILLVKFSLRICCLSEARFVLVS